jgi:hypothetical protein
VSRWRPRYLKHLSFSHYLIKWTLRWNDDIRPTFLPAETKKFPLEV